MSSRQEVYNLFGFGILGGILASVVDHSWQIIPIAGVSAAVALFLTWLPDKIENARNREET